MLNARVEEQAATAGRPYIDNAALAQGVIDRVS